MIFVTIFLSSKEAMVFSCETLELAKIVKGNAVHLETSKKVSLTGKRLNLSGFEIQERNFINSQKWYNENYLNGFHRAEY